jgi:hypothetical protein
MNKNFFSGIKICKKTGISSQNFEFLQYLLLAYPNGIVDDTLKEIARKIKICNHTTVLNHIKSL